MFEIMKSGGVLMYPIVFLSILSLAIFLERLFFLKTKRYIPNEFISKIYDSLNKKSFKEARILCANNKTAIAKICKDILENLDVPISRLMELAEESGRFQSKNLEKYLPTLQTIANISPLLGLLGTVIGMIKTFIAISEQGLGNAQALAGGISEALLTTAAGLSVAIPTVVFYYIIKHQSDKIILEMEKSTSRIINYIFKEN